MFRSSNKGPHQLIPGSQGQTWALQEVENALLIGHNRGTYSLNEDQELKKVSYITGGRDLALLSSDQILQASYTGLILLRLEDEEWHFDQRVENGNIQLKEFVLIDKTTLYGITPYNELYRMRLSDDLKVVTQKSKLNQISIPSSTRFIQDDSVCILNTIESTYLVQKDSLYKMTEPQISDLLSEVTLCLLDMTKVSAEEEYPEEVHLVHHIYSQDVTEYLIVEQNGYKILPELKLCSENNEIHSSINKIQVGNQILLPHKDEIELKANENDLTIFLKKPNNLFSSSTSKYKLEGWKDIWYNVPNKGIIDFQNLKQGSYNFTINNINSKASSNFKFKILPKWYYSKAAWCFYILSTLLALGLMMKMYQKRLLDKSNRILREKEKEMEAERIRIKNEKLRKEVELKSKMLANSAMTLVKKNELLAEMDNELIKIPTNEITSSQFKSRIRKLIRKNKNSEKDWQIFETNFTEIHQDFISKLIKTHPAINKSEIRMAAYIKMDLSSKEIAPLMHISPRSVENKRYRLRKKLDLPKTETLKRYLQNF